MSSKGYRHSKEALQKISAASKRRWASDSSYRTKMISVAHRPKPMSSRLSLSLREKHSYEYLKQLQPSELGYIAGMIDGEGTIGIRKRTGRNNCVLYVAVANTWPEVVIWIRDKVHGYWAGRGSAQPERAGRKVCYIWSTANTHAAAVLAIILPYLIIKKSQALLALEFQKYRFAPLAEQLKYKERMQELNKGARQRI